MCASPAQAGVLLKSLLFDRACRKSNSVVVPPFPDPPIHGQRSVQEHAPLTIIVRSPRNHPLLGPPGCPLAHRLPGLPPRGNVTHRRAAFPNRGSSAMTTAFRSGTKWMPCIVLCTGFLAAQPALCRAQAVGDSSVVPYRADRPENPPLAGPLPKSYGPVEAGQDAYQWAEQERRERISRQLQIEEAVAYDHAPAGSYAPSPPASAGPPLDRASRPPLRLPLAVRVPAAGAPGRARARDRLRVGTFTETPTYIVSRSHGVTRSS